MQTANVDTEGTLLLPGDAAKLLGVTPTRVRQLAEEGHLRCERTIGGVRLFRRADVEELRRQREAARA